MLIFNKDRKPGILTYGKHNKSCRCVNEGAHGGGVMCPGAERPKLIWAEGGRCFPVVIASKINVLLAEWRQMDRITRRVGWWPCPTPTTKLYDRPEAIRCHSMM